MYRHTQTGWLILIACGLPGVVLSIGGLAALGGDVGTATALLCTGLVLVGTTFLFCSLTVEVDEDAVTFWFGPGWIRKRIPNSEILMCDPVRNLPIYGWGIHWVPGGGWLWNVSGLGAVEVILKDGRRIRIGSDEPEVLSRFINERLS